MHKAAAFVFGCGNMRGREQIRSREGAQGARIDWLFRGKRQMHDLPLARGLDMHMHTARDRGDRVVHFGRIRMREKRRPDEHIVAIDLIIGMAGDERPEKAKKRDRGEKCKAHPQRPIARDARPRRR